MSASTSPTLPQAGPPAQFRATSATQYATAFEVSTVPVSPVGFVTVLTLYPNAPWPPGIVLTPQVSGIQGRGDARWQIPPICRVMRLIIAERMAFVPQ